MLGLFLSTSLYIGARVQEQKEYYAAKAAREEARAEVGEDAPTEVYEAELSKRIERIAGEQKLDVGRVHRMEDIQTYEPRTYGGLAAGQPTHTVAVPKERGSEKVVYKRPEDVTEADIQKIRYETLPVTQQAKVSLLERQKKDVEIGTAGEVIITEKGRKKVITIGGAYADVPETATVFPRALQREFEKRPAKEVSIIPFEEKPTTAIESAKEYYAGKPYELYGETFVTPKGKDIAKALFLKDITKPTGIAERYTKQILETPMGVSRAISPGERVTGWAKDISGKAVMGWEIKEVSLFEAAAEERKRLKKAGLYVGAAGALVAGRVIKTTTDPGTIKFVGLTALYPPAGIAYGVYSIGRTAVVPEERKAFLGEFKTPRKAIGMAVELGTIGALAGGGMRLRGIKLPKPIPKPTPLIKIPKPTFRRIPKPKKPFEIYGTPKQIKAIEKSALAYRMKKFRAKEAISDIAKPLKTEALKIKYAVPEVIGKVKKVTELAKEKARAKAWKLEKGLEKRIAPIELYGKMKVVRAKEAISDIARPLKVEALKVKYAIPEVIGKVKKVTELAKEKARAKAWKLEKGLEKRIAPIELYGRMKMFRATAFVSDITRPVGYRMLRARYDVSLFKKKVGYGLTVAKEKALVRQYRLEKRAFMLGRGVRVGILRPIELAKIKAGVISEAPYWKARRLKGIVKERAMVNVWKLEKGLERGARKITTPAKLYGRMKAARVGSAISDITRPIGLEYLKARYGVGRIKGRVSYYDRVIREGLQVRKWKIEKQAFGLGRQIRKKAIRPMELAKISAGVLAETGYWKAKQRLFPYKKIQVLKPSIKIGGLQFMSKVIERIPKRDIVIKKKLTPSKFLARELKEGKFKFRHEKLLEKKLYGTYEYGLRTRTGKVIPKEMVLDPRLPKSRIGQMWMAIREGEFFPLYKKVLKHELLHRISKKVIVRDPTTKKMVESKFWKTAEEPLVSMAEKGRKRFTEITELKPFRTKVDVKVKEIKILPFTPKEKFSLMGKYMKKARKEGVPYWIDIGKLERFAKKEGIPFIKKAKVKPFEWLKEEPKPTGKFIERPTKEGLVLLQKLKEPIMKIKRPKVKAILKEIPKIKEVTKPISFTRLTRFPSLLALARPKGKLTDLMARPSKVILPSRVTFKLAPLTRLTIEKKPGIKSMLKPMTRPALKQVPIAKSAFVQKLAVAQKSIVEQLPAQKQAAKLALASTSTIVRSIVGTRDIFGQVTGTIERIPRIPFTMFKFPEPPKPKKKPKKAPPWDIKTMYKPSLVGKARYEMFGEVIKKAPKGIVGVGIRPMTKKQVQMLKQVAKPMVM